MKQKTRSNLLSPRLGVLETLQRQVIESLSSESVKQSLIVLPKISNYLYPYGELKLLSNFMHFT